jgi:DNA-binding response OmpR family regulator
MPTVLLIDDDDPLREVLAQALNRAGYTVVQATDGREGVEVALVTAPDVVVTDLIMPVQEGVETIVALRRLRPKLPIIAISGGVQHASTYLGIAERVGAHQVLAKPFSAKELIAAIEGALAKNPPPDSPSAGAPPQ